MNESRGKAPLVQVLMLQRDAWKRNGARPTVEDLLRQHPHLANDTEAVLDLIYNETVLREEVGERVDHADYFQRFPHLAEALRLQFEVDSFVSERPADESPEGLMVGLKERERTTPHRPPSTIDSPTQIEHEEEPPPQVEGCDLLGELGRGAMGIVYRGWQRSARRPVAVKVLFGDVPLARIRTEAAAAARLQHPNIVQIFDVKEQAGRTALVLEYVEGGSLAQKLAGKPQSPRDAARLIETLAQAMAYAHEKGVIHRDLKPGNVLLSGGTWAPLAQCFPKISDFGLAKLLEGAGSVEHLTRTTDILGTPSYMAPEQASGTPSAIGPGADIYALGAILYECLTGRPPFLGEGLLDTLEQVRRQEPVPPTRLNPTAPYDLEVICLKCLHKTPSRRYGSALELAADLRRWQDGVPIRARPVGLIERAWKWGRRHPLAGTLVLLSVVLAVMLLTGGLMINRALREQRDRARQQAEALDEQLHAARHLLYTAHLLRVGSVWESDPLQALRMLEDPRHCPLDLRCLSWSILHGQCKRYTQVLTEHRAAVTAIASHPGGKLFASGSADGQIRLYSLDQGQWSPVSGQWSMGTKPVTALRFSTDGNLLAAGGEGGKIHLWDVQWSSDDGQWTMKPRPGSSLSGKGRINDLLWQNDNRTLIVAAGPLHGSGSVSIYDTRTWRLRRTLRSEIHPVSQIALSPDGHTIASAGRDNVIRLHDTRTGRLYGEFRGHTAPVRCLAFTSSGAVLISGGLDGAIRYWDLAREVEIHTYQAATGPVLAMALHPKGQALAVAGTGPIDSLRVWDGKGNAALAFPGALNPDEVVPDVQLWDLSSHRGGEPFRGHPGGVLAVAFSPDGKTLLTGGADQTVKVWSYPGPIDQVAMRGHTQKPNSTALSEDGRRLAWISRVEGSATAQQINVFDLVRGTRMNSFRGHDRPVHCLALSRDGQHLAAAVGHVGEPAELLVWDVSTGRLVQALSGHRGEVAGVVFAETEQTLISASRDGKIRVWDVATGKSRAELSCEVRPINAVIWAAGGYLAVGAGAGEPGPVRAGSGEPGPVRAGRGEPGPVRAGRGGAIFVWRGDDYVQQLRVDLPEEVSSLAAAPDVGKGSDAPPLLAYPAPGGRVQLLDIERGTVRESLRMGMKQVVSISFSSDGRTLAAAGTSPGVKLWDVPTLQERASLPRHKGGACFVAFGGRDRLLVTVSRGQVAQLFHTGE